MPTKVGALRRRLQWCRNSFTHGQPEALDDALVEELVGELKAEHQSRIAAYVRAWGRRARDPPLSVADWFEGPMWQATGRDGGSAPPNRL
ncbi:MAG: hypothetical protein F4X64_16640 [Chloroflexi bacterium]|nr:hypothetical protein [Chloroflexota bacterium]